ncbi:MAG: hypothetical protein EXR68_05565 [Dehalococcoidia bacterium]|nr:hypothetical protein [Dehalococcoidia bacterium]
MLQGSDRPHARPGWQAGELVPDARLQDSFKRELRYVYTATGESIDAAFIREGLALAWRKDGSQRA